MSHLYPRILWIFILFLHPVAQSYYYSSSEGTKQTLFRGFCSHRSVRAGEGYSVGCNLQLVPQNLRDKGLLQILDMREKTGRSRVWSAALKSWRHTLKSRSYTQMCTFITQIASRFTITGSQSHTNPPWSEPNPTDLTLGLRNTARPLPLHYLPHFPHALI